MILTVYHLSRLLLPVLNILKELPGIYSIYRDFYRLDKSLVTQLALLLVQFQTCTRGNN